LRHYGKEEGMIIPGRFCPECFMLPDPRTAYVGEGDCKVYSANTMGEHVEAQEMWERAESLTSDELLAFIDPRLAMMRVLAVVHLETVLHADFWWRIRIHDSYPDFAAPTLAQCLLIRQLGKAIAHFRVEQVNEIAKERRRYIPLDFSTLKREEGEHDCILCYETFKEPESIEEAEADKHKPIITACKHIFGEKCLLRWLHNNRRRPCPNCRRKVEPEQVEWYPRPPASSNKKAVNRKAEMVAEARDIPAWLLKLNGYDPVHPGDRRMAREKLETLQEECTAFLATLGFIKNEPGPTLRWVRPEFRRD
jgi:hypothetical protein